MSLDRKNVFSTVIEIAEADLGETFKDVTEATNLRTGLGMDSVDVVSLVSQVERRFRIRMNTEELLSLVTVGDMITLVHGKVEALEIPKVQE